MYEAVENYARSVLMFRISISYFLGLFQHNSAEIPIQLTNLGRALLKKPNI